jgi:hypothetical protein
MISKKASLLSIRLGRTRRSLIRNKGKRGTRLHFLEIVLKDNDPDDFRHEMRAEI